MAQDVFAVPVFFICFRECLETSIIVSVLLSFLKQTLAAEGERNAYKGLVKQVWIGVALGVFICLAIGGGMLGAFYSLGQDTFGNAESAWEGAFSLVASVIITIMGAALLRVSKLQDKWRVKLALAMEAKDSTTGKRLPSIKKWAEKYVMFYLPFITVLREGLEAVIFIGGVGLSFPAKAFPLPVITGLVAGVVVGYIIYRGGNQASLQIFLIVSTCFLYLVSAGLFSRGIWYLEQDAWNKAIGGEAEEMGAGPGSYDIRQSVWHVNCCSPLTNGGGGWGIFHAILGWTNSATYGSVIGYNVYWLAMIVWFVTMRHVEQQGRVPLLELIIQCWRPTKSVNSPMDRAGALPEATSEEKTMGSGVNSRLDEVQAA